MRSSNLDFSALSANPTEVPAADDCEEVTGVVGTVDTPVEKSEEPDKTVAKRRFS